MPAIENEVTTWGRDSVLTRWLTDHHIKTRVFSSENQKPGEIILVGLNPPDDRDTLASFTALVKHIAGGSKAVFLSPEVFRQGKNKVRYLPLANKGSLSDLYSWLYLKDEWAKHHPIFEGLPAGGLMDHQFYREIIPSNAWIGQDSPREAVAGAIKSSLDYSSGLMVSVNDFGAGQFILNTLLIRENLGIHPASERLLRNMIRYATREHERPALKSGIDFETTLKTIGYK